MELSLTYSSDELHLDPRMLQSLPVFGPNGHSALDGLAVHIQRAFLGAVLVKLDIDHLAVVIVVLEPNVDIQRGGEKVRHGGSGGTAARGVTGQEG